MHLPAPNEIFSLFSVVSLISINGSQPPWTIQSIPRFRRKNCFPPRVLFFFVGLRLYISNPCLFDTCTQGRILSLPLPRKPKPPPFLNRVSPAHTRATVIPSGSFCPRFLLSRARERLFFVLVSSALARYNPRGCLSQCA